MSLDAPAREEAASKIVGFHHIQIPIPPGGEDRARRFYGGSLGLEEIPKPPHLAVRGGLWFRAGAQEVHLGIERDHRPSERAHPAFLVAGLDELRRRLTDQHAETYEDLPLPGHRRFYAKDPFGNRLEFLEPDPHRDR
jgi:catechol 2,3-dioxygenase-like lactoylglutathione lyase family enzyme